MNSPKPSMLERMKPRGLLERLLSPTSQCLTIGTANEPSVTWTSREKESEKGPVLNLKADDLSEPKEAKEMRMMTASTMSQPTDDQKSTWTNSCGQYLTELKVAHYEASALPQETSSVTTPWTSSLLKRISSTQGLHPSSLTPSGSPSCWGWPSISTQSSVDVTLTQKYLTRSETSQSRLERLPLQSPSNPPGIGSLLGAKPLLLQSSPSHIEVKSVRTMGGTSLTSSLPLLRNITTSSSTTTERSENESHSAETSCSLTLPSSGTCECSTSMSGVQAQSCKCKRAQDDDLQNIQATHVCD